MPSSTPYPKLPFPHEIEKPLKDFSTFKIGGKAKFFSIAKTKEDMCMQLLFCQKHNIPVFILGKGSNTLFDDRGFNGLVIQNRIDYLNIKENQFEVGSGYSFARLGVRSAGLGFSGLEFAAGIPATVGGAVFMNAGAGGQETKDTLTSVTYFTIDGEEKVFKKEDLKFGYRVSPFQKWQGAIVEATFELSVLKGAKATQKKALEYRLKTQPYKDPSIGCIFRNPSPDAAAAFLIDKSGLKGMEVGGVKVSEKHANFIVNTKEGKASDVLDLIQKVKEKVYKETGILLEEEIRLIPYE